MYSLRIRAFSHDICCCSIVYKVAVDHLKPFVCIKRVEFKKDILRSFNMNISQNDFSCHILPGLSKVLMIRNMKKYILRKVKCLSSPQFDVQKYRYYNLIIFEA